MRPGGYLKDKLWELLAALLALLLILLMVKLFRGPAELLAAIGLVWLLALLLILGIDYGKKRRFYRDLLEHASGLDQKYLVLETLEEPRFYEGELVYQALWQMSKSMTERVAGYRRSVEDFKDYIELWVHEVKLPLASLALMCRKNGEEAIRQEEQLRRLDRYTDQVLYFARSENAHRDYLIREVRLAKLVHHLAMKYKDDLLLQDMAFSVEVEEDLTVLTDGKWLEFILGQLLANSMKYKSRQGEIRIFAEEDCGGVTLHVRDNGIGIPAKDLPRIFEKSFTGENGRKRAGSTGMGLYIVKQLCDQLGHGIAVTSEEGKFTDAALRFADNDFYRPRQ